MTTLTEHLENQIKRIMRTKVKEMLEAKRKAFWQEYYERKKMTKAHRKPLYPNPKHGDPK